MCLTNALNGYALLKLPDSTAHPRDDRLFNILDPRVSENVNGKEKLSSEFHNPVDMSMGGAYAGDG